MHIEHTSSNRIEKPLGTGVSAKHALNATSQWCRSAHEPKGTAQGNRGSATQGGDREIGLLPFNVLSSAVQPAAHVDARHVVATSIAAIAAIAAPAAVIAAISSFPLVREPSMAFMHFTLACAIVAVAFFVHVALACTSTAISWSRAGIA